MKCPSCGAWNKAFMPRCSACGTPLPNNTANKADWEDRLHHKKPDLKIVTYTEAEKEDELDIDLSDITTDTAFNPNLISQVYVAEEQDSLPGRREKGLRIKERVSRSAQSAIDSIASAEIIRPVPIDEPEKQPPLDARRRETAQRYTSGRVSEIPRNYDPKTEDPIIYDDSDPTAPILYDGYEPEQDPALRDHDNPHRLLQNRSRSGKAHDYQEKPQPKKQRSRFMTFLIVMATLAALTVVGLGAGFIFAKNFLLQQQVRTQRDNNTQVKLTETTVMVDKEEHPAHTLTIYGRENATVYLQETGTSYVIADGKMEVTIPDYMWYDTDSSTYAVPAEEDIVTVTLTPYIRYSQEGEQFAMDPIEFTVEAPLSPIYLLNPSAPKMSVGVSIYEVRINVVRGSSVMIDGTNVSSLIRDTGNVSKNVQVLPIGDNIINISVKSKYYRENRMEVTLHRDPQEIPLELSPTVITEWNYENNHELYRSSISGSTLPGATVTVESPHDSLTVNQETGEFSFRPLFNTLGDNDVIIRSSYAGKEDSVIHHTVYYMPTADVYTRKAWSLANGYSDLINFMQMRIGTIYVAEGEITHIISTSPQLAVMDIGEAGIEKEVMLENSSKTTWQKGTRYRIYGDVYGFYGSLPRLTVRYTYQIEE